MDAETNEADKPEKPSKPKMILRLAKATYGLKVGELVSYETLMEACCTGKSLDKAKLTILSWKEAWEVVEAFQQGDSVPKTQIPDITILVDPEGSDDVPEWAAMRCSVNKPILEWEKLGLKQVVQLPVRVGVEVHFKAQNIEVLSAESQADEVSLRVKVFRKHTAEADTWSRWRFRPHQAIAEALGPHVDQDFRNEGWTVEGPEDQEDLQYLVGYIRLPKAKSETPRNQSGHHGQVLLEQLKKDRDVQDERTVGWRYKQNNEEDAAYFRRVSAEAVRIGKPMICRRGGGSDLGIVGVEKTQRETATYILLGSPQHWSPMIVEQLLGNRGFESVSALSAPRSRKQGWLFQAKTGMGEKILTVGADKLRVRPYVRKPEAPQELPSKKVPSKPWAKVAQTEPAADAEMEAKEVVDGGEAADGAAPQQEGAGNEEPQPPQTKKSKTESGAAEHKMPHMLELMDTGGAGDCGFRSIAAQMAMVSKRPKEDILKQVATIGGAVRVRMHAHALANLGKIKQNWRKDTWSTEEEEAGTAPQNAEEWVNALLRPKRWIDFEVLRNIPRVLKVDLGVIVYNPKKGWKKQILIPAPTPTKNKELILIALKDRHYQTVVRPTEGWPKGIRSEWGSVYDSTVNWRGSGSKDSGKTASVEFDDDFGDWLDLPKSQANSEKSASTAWKSVVVNDGWGDVLDVAQAKRAGTTKQTKRRRVTSKQKEAASTRAADPFEEFHESYGGPWEIREEPKTPSAEKMESWWPGLAGAQTEQEHAESPREKKRSWWPAESLTHPFANWGGGFFKGPLGGHRESTGEVDGSLLADENGTGAAGLGSAYRDILVCQTDSASGAEEAGFSNGKEPETEHSSQVGKGPKAERASQVGQGPKTEQISQVGKGPTTERNRQRFRVRQKSCDSGSSGQGIGCKTKLEGTSQPFGQDKAVTAASKACKADGRSYGGEVGDIHAEARRATTSSGEAEESFQVGKGPKTEHSSQVGKGPKTERASRVGQGPKTAHTSQVGKGPMAEKDRRQNEEKLQAATCGEERGGHKRHWFGWQRTSCESCCCGQGLGGKTKLEGISNPFEQDKTGTAASKACKADGRSCGGEVVDIHSEALRATTSGKDAKDNFQVGKGPKTGHSSQVGKGPKTERTSQVGQGPKTEINSQVGERPMAEKNRWRNRTKKVEKLQTATCEEERGGQERLRFRLQRKSCDSGCCGQGLGGKTKLEGTSKPFEQDKTAIAASGACKADGRSEGREGFDIHSEAWRATTSSETALSVESAGSDDLQQCVECGDAVTRDEVVQCLQCGGAGHARCCTCPQCGAHGNHRGCHGCTKKVDELKTATCGKERSGEERQRFRLRRKSCDTNGSGQEASEVEVSHPEDRVDPHPMCSHCKRMIREDPWWCRDCGRTLHWQCTSEDGLCLRCYLERNPGVGGNTVPEGTKKPFEFDKTATATSKACKVDGRSCGGEVVDIHSEARRATTSSKKASNPEALESGGGDWLNVGQPATRKVRMEKGSSKKIPSVAPAPALLPECPPEAPSRAPRDPWPADRVEREQVRLQEAEKKQLVGAGKRSRRTQETSLDGFSVENPTVERVQPDPLPKGRVQKKRARESFEENEAQELEDRKPLPKTGSKKETGKADAFHHCCPLCGAIVRAATSKGLTSKFRSHVTNRHGEERKLRVKAAKAELPRAPGRWCLSKKGPRDARLGWKKITEALQPVQLTQIPMSSWHYPCPFCRMVVPKGETKYQDSKSTFHHLLQCHPRVKRKVAYLKSRKEFPEFWRSGHRETHRRRKVARQETRVENGHVMARDETTPIGHAVCRRCRLADTGSGQSRRALSLPCEAYCFTPGVLGRTRPRSRSWKVWGQKDEGSLGRIAELFCMSKEEFALRESKRTGGAETFQA